MSRRRFNPLTTFGVPLEGGGIMRPAIGPEVWVNTGSTVFGAGATPDRPFRTMQEAFDHIANVGESNGILYWLGDVREEVLTPLGVYGWKIVAAHGGRPHHSTDGGVVVRGNSASWREPASGATTGGALLTLRTQGWEIWGGTFVPKSDATAIRLRRAEDATYPDASHALISGVRITVGTAATTIGIEDHGGCSHVTVRRCEFETLATAMAHTTGAGIDAPNLYVIEDNFFTRNTNHIVLPLDQSRILRNTMDEATANIDIRAGLEGENFVLENQFGNNENEIAENDGYFGHANNSDVWRNWAADGDTMIAGVPT
jgi:hypothetical protein